jgi:macrophage erythroblast attacher
MFIIVIIINQVLMMMMLQLTDIDHEQQQSVERIDARLIHLSDLCHVDTFESSEWQRWSVVKVNRVLADYLLRENWHETADKLIRTKHIEVGHIR